MGMTRKEAINELAGMYRIAVADSLDATVEANKKNEAIDMAISALQAQEPRVMTTEEIDSILTDSSEQHDRIFWAEVKSRTRYSFGVFQLELATNDDYEALLLGCAWPAWYRRSSYGFRWRCWTSRPTDAQREATPWPTK